MNKLEELREIRIRLTQIYLELGNQEYVKADSQLNEDISLLKKNGVLCDKAEVKKI